MKKISNHDKMFYFGKDETPDVVACLFHPFFLVAETFHEHREIEGFGGVTYGLCLTCARQFRENEQEFKPRIERELAKRLKALKQEQE